MQYQVEQTDPWYERHYEAVAIIAFATFVALIFLWAFSV